ncbi:hypothetical protein NIES1031_08785 [Chroogloeocystis siderophila 5.2 s.c.1]|jgi:hypothetical protein|uniref:Uncharacterized protein n=2 Tax=Chroogloeocystis TaxID=329162 RepID=A0A1U7HV28_9CHRO|nr:hypothetical protein [Chroogloeocystis siderophila]OKH27385.1 hypothetical protein NIES1031_08785 [Chroogloeocystis siderophila 5.2 s.c.1]
MVPVTMLFLRQAIAPQLKPLHILPSLLLTGLLGCSSVPSALNSINNVGFGVDISQIADIEPTRDQDKTIYVQGRVAALVPLVDWLAYQVEDTSGTIWVLTNQRNIQLEDRVLIEGKLRYHSIPVAEQDFGEAYVEEHRQIERIPAK